MQEVEISTRIIIIHPDAPPKPPMGAPCNGCGVCCLLEPCPLGIVVSRRRHGACAALRWDNGQGRYRCGLLWPPRDRAAARRWGWLGVGRAWLQILVARWIAAGRGCDADLELDDGAPFS
jgi:hypothetical protein